MVKLLQMRVFLRTIYFLTFSVFFTSLPFNAQASVVADTASNIVDFYTYSTTSLLKETGKSVGKVADFYKPLAVSSADNFQNIFHTAFIASDSILNGLISVGKGVQNASEYSVVRTGEGLGNTVAEASTALSKIPNLNVGSSLNDFASEIINVHSNIGNAVLKSTASVGNSAVEVTASGYNAFRSIHIGYVPSPIDLSKKVWNVFSSLGNTILESSEHVVTKTGNTYGGIFEVVDRNFDEATVALGNAGYQGVANIFSASNLISKNILGVEEFFVDGVARGVVDSSTQVAGIGSVFSSFMDKLSDSFVPLFSNNIASPDINTNFNQTKPNVVKNNQTQNTLPGTNTIVERIIEKSSYSPYSLSLLNNLRIELIALNSQSVEYLKELINRTEYKTAEVTYRSGSSSGTLTSVDASGGTTGLTFTGGPVTTSGTLSLGGVLNISNGGTGTSTAPTYGKVLLGNSLGGYDLIATSSLGITSGSSVTGSTGQIAYFSDTDTAVGTSTIFISPTENFGIGSISPAKKLHVVGETFIDGSGNSHGIANPTALTVDGSAGNNVLELRNSSGSAFLVATNDYGRLGIGTTTPFAKLAVTGSGAGTGLAFAVANSSDSPKFIIQDNGNVAIGYTSSSDALDVNGKVWATNVQATSQFMANSASASSPGYSSPFYSTSGMFFPTTDVIAFSSAGTESMRINASGNVGIGTAVPSSKLDVRGGDAIFSDGMTTLYQVGTASFQNGLVTIDDVELNINNDTTVINLSDGGIYLNNENLAIGANYGGVAGSPYYFDGNGNIRASAGSFSGNVGIGTSTPYAKLSVVGEVVASNFTSTTTATSTFAGPIQFSSYSSTPQISSPDGITGIHFDSAGQISFHTNGSQRAIFNSSGQLGLASTTPFGLLSLNPNGITGPSFVIGSSTATSLIVTNGGKVGIGGTLTPTHNLDVGGTYGAQLVVGQSGQAGVINFRRTDGASSGTIGYGSAGDGGEGFTITSGGGSGAITLSAQGGAINFTSGNNPNAVLSSGGFFGIGTTTPWGKLSVNPNGITGPSFVIGSSTATSLIVTNGGNVGIGTTTPNTLLNIGGSLTTTATGGLNFGGDVASNLYRNGSGSIKTDGSLTVAGNINYLGGALGNSITGSAFIGTGNDNGITLQSRAFSTAGKVAVTMSTGSVTNSSGIITAVAITPTYNQTSVGGGTDLLINRTQTAVGSGLQLLFDAQVGGSSKFVINNQGYVGIGTTTPWGKLSVNPNGITGPSFVIGSSTATSLIVTNGGNVGVGTTTPGSLFSIGGVANFSTATSTFYSTGGGINIATGCFAIAGVCVGGGGSSQWTTSGSDIYYATGNIGIGTTTAPTATLSLYNEVGTTNIDFTSSVSTLFTLGTDGSDNSNFKISTPSFGGNDVFVIASNVVSTSYSNSGGTGNRTSLITVTDSGSILFSNNTSHLINGSNGNGDWFVAGALSSSNWVKFDFGVGHPRVIQEATYTQQTSVTQGVWQWQGSNDDSSWTDIGSSFTLGGSTTDVITELSANTLGYRYYRMLGVSGSTNSGPVVYQMDFKLTESTGGLPYVGINDVDPSAALDVTGWGTGTNFTFRTQNSSNTSTFVILDNGNVGIGTTSPTLGPLSLASGAYVTTGGTWTNASDRNLKENLKEVDENSILAKISELSITQWNYKSEATSTMHIGPMAQDFFATFGLGGSNTSISTIDPAGVALLGIKAINLNLNTIASTTASTTPASLSFASSFFDSIYRHVSEWLASAGNGITNIFSKKVVTDELCVGSTCVTESQLQALLQNAGQSITVTNTTTESNVDTSGDSSTTTENTSTTTDETVDNSGGGDTVIPEPDPAPEIVPEPEATPEPDPAPAPEPTPDTIPTP